MGYSCSHMDATFSAVVTVADEGCGKPCLFADSKVRILTHQDPTTSICSGCP